MLYKYLIVRLMQARNIIHRLYCLMKWVQSVELLVLLKPRKEQIIIIYKKTGQHIDLV